MERPESASAGFAHQGYRFGGYRLQADGTLLHGESRILLHARELAALRLLLAHPGRIISPLEVKQALWGDQDVAPDSVSRCLATLRRKLEPEECIQTVYKRGYRLSVDVQPLTGGRPALPRLAILPFTTGYGVPEHLGVTVPDEAGTRLAAFRPPFVHVLARDSVFHLFHRGLAPQRIAQMLEANLVLSGTLRALPSHYRLHVEMIDAGEAPTGEARTVWTEDLLIERTRTAGLETALIELLHLRMGPVRTSSDEPSLSASAEREEEFVEPQMASALRTEHQARRHEAYELYQRARFEWQTLERHRMQDAHYHLLRAIELDPGLTAARVEFSHLCAAQPLYGHMHPTVAGDHLRRAAEPAALEGMLPALGWIHFHVDRNLPAALWRFAQSAHLPYHPWNARIRGHFVLSRHRFAEAVEMLESDIRSDPYQPWQHGRLAWAYHLAGDAARSVQFIRAALERFPDSEPPMMYGSVILGFNGEAATAVDLARRLTQQLPHFDPATLAHAYALAVAGESDAARAILDHFEWLSRERYALRSFLPAIYIALGDPERALLLLHTAEQSRCPWFFQMLADPRLTPLRGHPEFQSMLDILAGMEAEAERDAMSE
jgi:DNA-binding winged helix-turn-helix (wHTH) protein/tetratricopeptide (TPR) repeat protein